MINNENYIDLSIEKQWIEEAKLNSSAFKPIYTKYYDEIYRFIYRRTGKEVLSSEICSETFYKALSNIDKYQWMGIPIGNWLYSIAANEVKKHFRNRKKMFIVELDKFQENVPVEETIVNVDVKEIVWVLDQLSEIELRLIELKYFENKTFREVASLLKMKESTVKMRVYRLLLTMRKLLIKKND